jgi:hypothetical protein
MEITKDDLKDMAKKGKLPKGMNPWKDESPEGEAHQEGPIDILAGAATKAVEESGKMLQANSSVMQMVIATLKSMKEAPITVNVPGVKEWKEAEIEVTERDFNGNIRKLKMRKVS